MLLLKLIEGFCSCRVVMTDPALDVNFCDDVTGYAARLGLPRVRFIARMLQCEPQHDGLIVRCACVLWFSANSLPNLPVLCLVSGEQC